MLAIWVFAAYELRRFSVRKYNPVVQIQRVEILRRKKNGDRRRFFRGRTAHQSLRLIGELGGFCLT